MRNNQTPFLLLFISLSGLWIIQACSKDKVASEVDLQLLEFAQTPTGFVWYKNTSTLLDKSSGSGHPEAYLRTRYNTIAASKLDANGKIQAGETFPEGAVIVKELFENTTALRRYAILYKDSANTYADANGWVWGYIDADGTVAESATKKGSSCIGCHTQSGNIDYMLMNKFFP
jgi:hypothetical protein